VLFAVYTLERRYILDDNAFNNVRPVLPHKVLSLSLKYVLSPNHHVVISKCGWALLVVGASVNG